MCLTDLRQKKEKYSLIAGYILYFAKQSWWWCRLFVSHDPRMMGGQGFRLRTPCRKKQKIWLISLWFQTFIQDSHFWLYFTKCFSFSLGINQDQKCLVLNLADCCNQQNTDIYTLCGVVLCSYLWPLTSPVVKGQVRGGISAKQINKASQKKSTNTSY